MDLPSPSLPPTLFCIDDSPQALGPRNSDRGNAACHIKERFPHLPFILFSGVFRDARADPAVGE
jgi:hypothetical protein